MEKDVVADASSLESLDVVLLGDSITDHWMGLSLGDPSKKFENITPVFQSLFQRENGGEIDGIELGLSGEKCTNVLYRLQQGILGDIIQPKVFWLLIGTNDIGGYACSVDAVVAGNIAIVDELQKQRPNAKIVINGILPRAHFLWVHIVEINKRLECYANITEGVEYFNATDIFLTDDEKIVHTVDNLHPDEEGHLLWGTAIVEKVKEIIDKP